MALVDGMADVIAHIGLIIVREINETIVDHS